MKRMRYLALALILIGTLVITQPLQADVDPVSEERPVLVILLCSKDSDTDTQCGSTFTATQNANGPNTNYAPSYAPLTLADRALYDRILFGAKPSTRDFFQEISYDKFTIKKAAILGWYVAPQPEDFYRDEPQSVDCSACNGQVHHPRKWTDAIKAADRSKEGVKRRKAGEKTHELRE